MGEDMFKDLSLSKEAMTEYHAKLPSTSFGQRLSVMVLQRSAWPFTVTKKTVDLPISVRFPSFAFLCCPTHISYSDAKGARELRE
jgi:hypothetical protein